MKKIVYLGILLLGFFLAGCDSDEDEILAFSIQQSDVCFAAKGGEGYIDVVAPGSFQVTATADWCTPATQGNRIKVSVSPNPEYSSRTALIRVNYAGNTLSVPVTQSGSILILENKDLRFKPATGRYAFEVDNNVDQWTASVPEGVDWCTPVISTDTLALELKFNPKATERTTQVTLVSGKVTKQLTVTQEGIRILPSQEELMFSSTGGTEEITFTDIPEGWTAVASETWCELQQQGNILSVTTPLYTNADDRNATITISIGEVTATIPVTQQGLQPLNIFFCSSKTKWNFDPAKTTGDYSLIFQMIEQELSEGLGETLVSAYLSALMSNKGTHALTFITFDGSALSESSLTYTFEPTAGTEDQVVLTFTLGALGDYAAWYYNNIQGIKYLASYLNSTFILTSNDPVAPTEITFTDAADPDLSFTLTSGK